MTGFGANARRETHAIMCPDGPGVLSGQPQAMGKFLHRLARPQWNHGGKRDDKGRVAVQGHVS